MNDALVTVLMPVYNACDYVAASINSVIGQEFDDWHLLVINDGSKDNTEEVLKQFQDHPRITIQNNPKNLKLITTLNNGLKQIKSPYIARLDADDIMQPNRLGEQVRFMEANRNVVLCGTGFSSFSNRITAGKDTMYPSSQEEIVFRHLVNTSFCHPSIILRNNTVDELLFDVNYPHAEDYELFERISALCSVTNLKTIGTSYRIHEASVSVKNKRTQALGKKKVQNRAWSRFNMISTSEKVGQIEALLNQDYQKIKLFLLEEILEGMLNKDAIQSIPSLDYTLWCAMIGQQWFNACWNTKKINIYKESKLSRYRKMTMAEKLACRAKTIFFNT